MYVQIVMECVRHHPDPNSGPKGTDDNDGNETSGGCELHIPPSTASSACQWRPSPSELI